MALEVKIGGCNGVVVVSCIGRIVFGEETTILCKTVRDLLPDRKAIVLNLKNVEHMDSGGVGALVGLVLSARRIGGDVKLCNLSRRVHQVLHITRVDAVLDVFAEEEAAVAAFCDSRVAA